MLWIKHPMVGLRRTKPPILANSPVLKGLRADRGHGLGSAAAGWGCLGHRSPLTIETLPKLPNSLISFVFNIRISGVWGVPSLYRVTDWLQYNLRLTPGCRSVTKQNMEAEWLLRGIGTRPGRTLLAVSVTG